MAVALFDVLRSLRGENEHAQLTDERVVGRFGFSFGFNGGETVDFRHDDLAEFSSGGAPAFAGRRLEVRFGTGFRIGGFNAHGEDRKASREVSDINHIRSDFNAVYG